MYLHICKELIQPFVFTNALISPIVLTFRGEANFVGQSDEDQGTDNEICTVATAKVGSGRRRSASRSTFDKIEGSSNTMSCSLHTFLDCLSPMFGHVKSTHHPQRGLAV